MFWLTLTMSTASAFVPPVSIFPNWAHHGVVATTTTTTALAAAAASTSNNSKPFAVIVKAKIDPNRLDEFLTLMEINAKKSRQEPGCLRFDVLRSQEDDNSNEFFFYELYENVAAVDFHKTQDHYNLWANFKASGGALESISYKTNGEFITP
jgi:(4S)-4-hydroxy-5-phosphonooxypentane-2,3-dione isomerase